jgi:hypothetical protein
MSHRVETQSGGKKSIRSDETAPEIAPVLAWWLHEIRTCLGQKIHSVLLCGSATLDDFCPRSSDVDVCVVLRTPITPEEGESIGNIHDRMRDRFIRGGAEAWKSGQAVEGSYIPIELVADENLQAPCYTAGGRTRRWAVCQPISPFDRYILAHFGRVLSGAPVSFTPPRDLSLSAQAEIDLRAFFAWNSSEQSAIWLAGMLHWAARSLVFWRDGTMLSKSAALEHEIVHGSPFAAAFQTALTIRREGSAVAEGYREELTGYFCRMACDLVQEIGRYLKARRDTEPSG